MRAQEKEERGTPRTDHPPAPQRRARHGSTAGDRSQQRKTNLNSSERKYVVPQGLTNNTFLKKWGRQYRLVAGAKKAG